MLAALEELLLTLRVQGSAGDKQRCVVGIQQRDRNQLAGLHQFIGASVHQFVENRIKALGRNRPAPEPHDAQNRTERVGDFLGPIAQVGLGGFFDPQVFLDLPAEDHHPDSQE